jgi:hypothetical protein
LVVVHHWWIVVQKHLICFYAQAIPPKRRLGAKEAQMTAAICSGKQGIMTSPNKDICCSLRRQENEKVFLEAPGAAHLIGNEKLGGSESHGPQKTHQHTGHSDEG